MPAALLQILRSRWFVLVLHTALWLCLYLAIAGVRGRMPGLHESPSASGPTQPVLPVAKLEPLFASGLIRQTICNPTNAPSPFFTRHFVPPAPPAPPPPTTRKLALIYQGFYQTANGPRHAVLDIEGGLAVVRVGALVATNVYVADATLQTVVLTNTTRQTNTLMLNTKKEIEVPIR